MAGEKKRRASGTQGIPGIGIPPAPDGTIDAADRRHVSGFVTPGDEAVAAVTADVDDEPRLYAPRRYGRPSLRFPLRSWPIRRPGYVETTQL